MEGSKKDNEITTLLKLCMIGYSKVCKTSFSSVFLSSSHQAFAASFASLAES